MRTPRRIVRTAVSLATLMLLTSSAGLAAAQTLPGPTMTGEIFTGHLTMRPPCASGNPFQFQSFGPAVGPFPGTYLESGTFGSAIGENEFSAFFEVSVPGPTPGSRVVTVQGRKFGTIVLTCTPDSRIMQFEGTVMYEATIDPIGPNRSFDRGVSVVSGFVNLTNAPATEIRVFNETFTSIVDIPAIVVLSPLVAENPVGTMHTVTATLLNAIGGRVEGEIVHFTVTGSVDTTGQCTTDSDGMCSFTYQGPPLPGADVITATSGTAVPGEAVKAWVLPPQPPEPGKCTGGGHILHNGMISGASFGFNAKTTGLSTHGSGNFIDHRAKVKIHLENVKVLMIAGTHATFFGDARINGVDTTYRIDVDDMGTPGKGRDTFTIQTATGYTASGILTGGEIKIH